MQKVPEWITILLAFFSALGLGGWLMELYRRKYPTDIEKLNIKNSKAEFIKKYTDAQLAHLELSKEVQEMVDQKTKQLENILVQRELVHAQHIESFIKKLAEETARKEEYIEQLKDAHKEVIYWKGLYEELQRKYEGKNL
jgi:mevalonate kinase